MHKQARGAHPTTQQLRRDINRGLTGEKIPAHDPAAEPLGTDDEAAGTPPSPDNVGDAREREAIGRPPDAQLAQGSRPPDRRRSPGSLMHVSWIALIFVLLLTAALAVGLWRLL